jgi:hypothetical protein
MENQFTGTTILSCGYMNTGSRDAPEMVEKEFHEWGSPCDKIYLNSILKVKQ